MLTPLDCSKSGKPYRPLSGVRFFSIEYSVLSCIAKMKSELVSLSVLALFLRLVAANIPAEPSLDEIDSDNHNFKTNFGEAQQDATAYAPWTHKPVCTEYLDEMEGELCVYTDANFSNGRGISIFTTARGAKEVLASSLYQDSTALSSRGINADLDDNQRPWYTANVPGKGTGMLASRPLQRGDLITAYTPYLIAPMEAILSTMQREYYLRIALDQLPQASQDKYLALAKIYNEPSVVVQDVVKANAFGIHFDGKQHLAVFPETSRFNHACAPKYVAVTLCSLCLVANDHPSAQYYLTPDLLTHWVHAVRPIAADEELTISYAPPLRTRALRQLYFQNTFQFNCSCARCSPPEHSHRTVLDSDQTTLDIMTLQSALGEWHSDSPATVKQAEQLIQLYKDEGLDAFLDEPYGHAALMYSSVGSVRGAQKYAKLAAEATKLKYGPDDGKWKEWEVIARDPMAHSSWRKRKG
jgi:hypothetical protein